MKSKKCTKCNEVKSVSLFNLRKDKNIPKNKYRSECKDCRRKYLLTIRSGQIVSRKKSRYIVLEHYSGGKPKCVCCGEDTIEFLCIDHINGGGNVHRKKIGRTSGMNMTWWLKKNNFPDGFQVLCHNCNCAKGFYGKCPHIR